MNTPMIIALKEYLENTSKSEKTKIGWKLNQ